MDKIAELEAKFSELEEMITKKDAVITSLNGENETLKKEVDALKTENKMLSDNAHELDKKLTLLKVKEKAEKNTMMAENIMSTILAESTIPDSLHPKVRNMVNAEDFIAENGVLDVEPFTGAFAAEVKSWEDGLPKGAVIGVSDEKTVINQKEVPFSEENKAILSSL